MGLSLWIFRFQLRSCPPLRLAMMSLSSFRGRMNLIVSNKNADGEIVVMTPVGYAGARRELFLAVELERWAA